MFKQNTNDHEPLMSFSMEDFLPNKLPKHTNISLVEMKL